MGSVTLGDSPLVTPAPQQKQKSTLEAPAPRQTEKGRNAGQTGDGTYSSLERDETPTAEPPLQTQTTYDVHEVMWSQREVLEPVGGGGGAASNVGDVGYWRAIYSRRE